MCIIECKRRAILPIAFQTLFHANDALLDFQRLRLRVNMILIHFVLGYAACRSPRAGIINKRIDWGVASRPRGDFLRKVGYMGKACLNTFHVAN